MNLTDDYLLASLATLANIDSCNATFEVVLDYNIPFGNIAFIKEKFWKLGYKYKESKEKRGSHPGLSISEAGDRVAFGSSQLSNRDKKDKNNFFVNQDECEIIKKNMVFLLNTYIPTSFDMIDKSKGTSYSELCPTKIKELRDVIGKTKK